MVKRRFDPPPRAALERALQAPPSREAWLDVYGWIYLHRDDPGIDEVVTEARAALAHWPTKFRVIASDTYLDELRRGDRRAAYWALGCALELESLSAVHTVPAKGDADTRIRTLDTLVIRPRDGQRLRMTDATIAKGFGRLPAITSLHLEETKAGARAVHNVLLEAPRLAELSIHKAALRGGSLASVLDAPACSVLRALDVSQNDLHDTDLVALSDLPLAQTLEVCRFARTRGGIVGENRAALRLPRLRVLDLRETGTRFARWDLEPALSWDLPSLTRLELAGLSFDDADVDALATWLPRTVRELDLSNTRFERPESVERLARREGPLTINLRGSNVPEEILSALAARYPTTRILR
jgi:hypothetical protein